MQRRVTDFIVTPILPRPGLRDTSRSAYSDLLASNELQGQAALLLDLYRRESRGYTDAEAALLLGWPRSTVSARRNDLNKFQVKALEAQNITPYYLVVNVGGERRQNPGEKSKTGLVWKYHRFANSILEG